MNAQQFRAAAEQQIESTRRELKILVGTDRITPDEAKKRLEQLKLNIEMKAAELARYK